jgi:hypothetical protein
MELRSRQPFALEYEGHSITGMVRVATAAEKIRHSARVDRARATDDQEAIIIAMDDAVDAVLVDCNITIDGQRLDEVARELYVGLMPLPVKLEAIGVSFGLSEIGQAAEGNSEPGRGST